jgi:hypothetical protein
MVVTKVLEGKLEMKHCGWNVSEESGRFNMRDISYTR